MTKSLTLEEVKTRLNSLLGPHFYSRYECLIEAFLAGRITRGEAEGCLRTLLSQDVLNKKPIVNNGEKSLSKLDDGTFSLHNRHIELVLERLASAELQAVKEVLCENKSVQVEAENMLENNVSFTVEPLVIGEILNQMTNADHEVFQMAMERCEISPPLDATEDARISAVFEDEILKLEQRHRRNQSEHPNAVNSRRSNPVLCQLDGVLPDTFIVRNVLVSWMRAYGLDSDSIEDEHVSLLIHAVQLYLVRVTRAAIIARLPNCFLDETVILDQVEIEAADVFGL